MTMKPGAKKISGQPDRFSLVVVEQRTDSFSSAWCSGPLAPIPQEFAYIPKLKLG